MVKVTAFLVNFFTHSLLGATNDKIIPLSHYCRTNYENNQYLLYRVITLKQAKEKQRDKIEHKNFEISYSLSVDLHLLSLNSDF